MPIETEVSLYLRAKDAASDVLDRVGAKVKGFSGAVMRNAETIRNAGVVMTGLGVVGLMASKKLVDGAARIEAAMANVNTMMAKGQDAHAMFNDEINRLITTIPVAGGKVEALSGMYMVLSAGIEAGSKATEFLEEAMKAAKAGMTEVAVAVDAMTTVMNAYPSVGYKAEEVSSLLFQTIKMGKMNYDELAAAIGPVVAYTAQVGVTFVETAATMATLTKAGLAAKRAGTALRGMMISFLKPSEEMTRTIQDNAQAWGVMTDEMMAAQSGLDRAQGGYLKASMAVAELTAALEAGAPVPKMMRDSLADARGEVESTRAEFQRHADSLRGMTEQYNDAAGAIKGLSDEMAVVSLEESKNRLEVMRIRQQADDSGRELTEGELGRIGELEEANDRLAIKQADLSIQQKEIQIEQSARTDLMGEEKAAMESLNVTIGEQEGIVNTAQTAIDDWTTKWEGATQAQLGAAEEQKTAAELSMGAWQENLDEASASAVTLMLETHGLQGSLGLLAQVVDGDTAALAALFPNAEAMVGVLPLVGEMAGTAAQDIETMGNAAGAAGEAYDKTADTYISKSELLAGRMEVAQEAMAEGSTPAMLAMNEATVWGAEGMAYYNEQTGGAIGAMMTYGSAAMSVIGPIMALIGQLAMLRMAKLATAAATGAETTAENVSRFSKLKLAIASGFATVAQWLHNVSLYACPLVWIVIAIMAVVAAIALLIGNWDKASEAVGRLAGWIKEGLGKAFDWLKGAFNKAKEYAQKWLDFHRAVFDKVKNGLAALGDKVKSFAKGVGAQYDKMKKFVGEKLGGLVSAAKKKWGEMKKAAIDTAKSMLSKYKDSFSKMKSAAKNAANKIGGFFKGLKDKASKWGKGLVDKFKSGMQKAGDKLKKAATSLGGKIKKGLGFSRPPDEGPLKDTMKWGEGLVTKYMEGVKKAFPFVGSIMNKLGGMFGGWGTGAIDSFSRSIEDGKDNLAKVLRMIGETARDFLGFSTPPPKGEFKNMPVWGGHGLDSFGGGMLKRLPAFQKQLNEATASLAMNLPTPTIMEGGGETNIGTQDMSSNRNEYHIYPADGDPENIARMLGSILDRRAMRA